MKHFKKGDCKCGVSRNDLVMAVGAAIFALGKALSVYIKYNKQMTTGDSAKAELRNLLKKAGIK